MTEALPKCLTEVNGVTILERLISSLNACNIDRLIVVVGHLENCIRDYLKNLNCGLQIEYVCNEKYNTTNNVYSLWVAQDLINEAFLLIECDLIFDEELLENMVKPDRIAVSEIQPWMNGTTVSLDSLNQVIQFHSGVDQTSSDVFYKTVNMYSFSLSSWNHVKRRVEKCISHGRVNEYYEVALAELVAEEKIRFKAIFFDDEKWDEIDTLEDLRRAEQLFPNVQKSISLSDVGIE